MTVVAKHTLRVVAKYILRVVAKHTLRVVAKHTLREVKKQHAVQCHIPETLRLQTRAVHHNCRRIDMRAIRRHIVGHAGVASWAWRNCHSTVLCAAYALAHNSLQVLAVGVARAQVLAQCQAVYTPTLQKERVKVGQDGVGKIPEQLHY